MAAKGTQREMQEIQAARTSGTKRPEEEGANVNSESKRPREDDDDKEEEEPGRRYTDWLQIWSYMCKLEDETDLKPMRYTDEPSDHNDFTPCLEVFSVKVSELEGWLEWPVDVFGFIAVRDTLDRKRNFIFKRDDLDPQTLTSEDSSLVLTGPCRAVELLGIVDFEIELKIKGNRQSENKTFISDYLQYDPGGRSDFDSIVQTETCSGKRGTIAVTFAHLTAALEAPSKSKLYLNQVILMASLLLALIGLVKK